MIVFSNTTPFIALSSVRKLNLLPSLFGVVHVVDAVAEECAAGGPIPVPDLRTLSWVRVVEGSHPAQPATLSDLGIGEKLTIHAALLWKADRIVIDEKIGRDIAEYLGLSVTGTLGVLLKAKQIGLIESFSDLANQLIGTRPRSSSEPIIFHRLLLPHNGANKRVAQPSASFVCLALSGSCNT